MATPSSSLRPGAGCLPSKLVKRLNALRTALGTMQNSDLGQITDYLGEKPQGGELLLYLGMVSGVDGELQIDQIC